jgi:hypothetical protein
MGVAAGYYLLLVPTLNKRFPKSQLLSTGIATLVVNSIVAAYVFILLPYVKREFGQQSTVTMQSAD